MLRPSSKSLYFLCKYELLPLSSSLVGKFFLTSPTISWTLPVIDVLNTFWLSCCVICRIPSASIVKSFTSFLTPSLVTNSFEMFDLMLSFSLVKIFCVVTSPSSNCCVNFSSDIIWLIKALSISAFLISAKFNFAWIALISSASVIIVFSLPISPSTASSILVLTTSGIVPSASNKAFLTSNAPFDFSSNSTSLSSMPFLSNLSSCAKFFWILNASSIVSAFSSIALSTILASVVPKLDWIFPKPIDFSLRPIGE